MGIKVVQTTRMGHILEQVTRNEIYDWKYEEVFKK